MKVTKEQRRHPRLKCIGPAFVQVSVEKPLISARIVDLSLEGCLIQLTGSSEPIPKGAIVELTFHVNQLPFRVRAQVRAVRPDLSIGFEFPALSARVRRQLGDLIEELAEAQQKQKHLLDELRLRDVSLQAKSVQAKEHIGVNPAAH